MGDGRIFLKTSAPHSLMTIYRLKLPLARSISWDSTFKFSKILVFYTVKTAKTLKTTEILMRLSLLYPVYFTEPRLWSQLRWNLCCWLCGRRCTALNSLPSGAHQRQKSFPIFMFQKRLLKSSV